MERRGLACKNQSRSEGSRHGLRRLSICECLYTPDLRARKQPYTVKRT